LSRQTKNGFSLKNAIETDKIRKNTGRRLYPMESVGAYFQANPAAFTLLAISLVVLILYFILSKLIKLAIIVLLVILLGGGAYFFKDPASTSDKIKKSVETFKTGGEAIGDKLSRFWQDTREIGGKVTKVPGEISKMLDTADTDAKKEFKKK